MIEDPLAPARGIAWGCAFTACWVVIFGGLAMVATLLLP